MSASSQQKSGPGTVLVTGGSSDIGLAVCKAYLQAGWHVTCHFRRERPELTALLSRPGIDGWEMDFADEEAFGQALDTESGWLCRHDALINLAAVLSVVPFAPGNRAAILHSLSVNLLPALELTALLGPAMAERGFGRIVQGSSIGVRFGGGTDSFAYALSKHALEFIPSAARKWAAQNVYVNAARIGVTDTRIHRNIPGKSLQDRASLVPARRAATPDEMAETLFWLGSEKNHYITNECISISGGE